MIEKSNEKQHSAAISILLLITFCIYAQTIPYEFAYDDILQITESPLVNQNENGLSALKKIFTSPTPPGDLYRPLPLSTLKLNFLFSGLQPEMYHFTNVIIFGITIILLYIFLLPVFQKRKLLAFLTTLLFLIHPLKVEVIANIASGRPEMLSLLFTLGAALIFRKWIQQQKWFSLFFPGWIFLFVCALFSKESSYTHLLSIPLYGFLTTTPSSEKLRKMSSGFFILLFAALCCLSIRGSILQGNLLIQGGEQVHPENPLFHTPFFGRIIPATKLLGDYIRLLFLPLHLSADYSLMPEAFLDTVYSCSGLLSIILSIVFILLLFFSRSKAALFSLLWFFITFALTLNFIVPIGTLFAERLAFTPSIGFFTFLVTTGATLIQKRPGSKIFLYPLLTICIVFYGWKSFSRIPVWKNFQTLYFQTVLDAPESSKAAYNYGLHLFVREKNYAEAEKYFRKTLKLQPTHLHAMEFAADLARMRGDRKALGYWYRRILRTYPNHRAHKELEKLNNLETE